MILRRLPTLFVLTVAAYLPGLGDPSALTQSDEFRVSLGTALESLASEGFDWMPRLGGEPRLAKPPLFYWLLELGFASLGASLWVARLPGVLLAAACACLTESIARRTGAAPPGVAGWLLAASLGLGVLGRLALLDVPLLACVLLAVHCWLRFEERGAAGWSLAAFGVLGLSVLVKGPLGAWVGGAAIGARVALGGGGAARRADLALGALLFAGVALAWPLAMAALHGEVFTDVVRAELFEKRFAREGSGGPHAVVGGLLLLALPWTPLLAAPLARVPHRLPADAGAARERRLERWLWLWIAAALLPFLFARSGFERYALPALPAAALLAARAARRTSHPTPDAGSGGADARGGRLLAAARVTTAIAIALAGGALLALFAHVGAGSAAALAAGAAVLAVFGVQTARGRLRDAALAFLAFQAVFFGALYPALGVNRLPEGLVQRIGARPVASFGSRSPALLAMSLGRPVPRLGGDADALAALAARDGWIAVSGEGRAALEEHLRSLGYGWRVIESWRSLHTRSTALRVYRRSASEAELRAALASGSLDALREEFALLGGLERRAP